MSPSYQDGQGGTPGRLGATAATMLQQGVRTHHLRRSGGRRSGRSATRGSRAGAASGRASGRGRRTPRRRRSAPGSYLKNSVRRSPAPRHGSVPWVIASVKMIAVPAGPVTAVTRRALAIVLELRPLLGERQVRLVAARHAAEPAVARVRRRAGCRRRPAARTGAGPRRTCTTGRGRTARRRRGAASRSGPCRGGSGPRSRGRAGSPAPRISSRYGRIGSWSMSARTGRSPVEDVAEPVGGRVGRRRHARRARPSARSIGATVAADRAPGIARYPFRSKR